MSEVEIPGKSKEQAVALLKAADAAGVDRKTIKATNAGFIVPAKVKEVLDTANKPKKAPVKKKATESSEADNKKEGKD